MVLAGAVFMSDALRADGAPGAAPRANSTLSFEAAREEGAKQHALVVFVIVLIALGLCLNGMVVIYNVAMVSANFVPENFKESVTWERHVNPNHTSMVAPTTHAR